MNTLQNTLLLLENYNALIKYHIKAYKESVSDERSLDLAFESIPDIDIFKLEVEQILQQGEYSEDFVYLLNRPYLLSQSNSDLFASYSAVEKLIYREYPLSKDLEKFSFSVYEFIRDEVFCSKLWNDDKYPLTKMTEFQFKNDESILWQTYYLLQNITEAYLIQEKQDVEHQFSFKSEPDKEKFIQQQKEIRAKEIINMSNGLCDKNLPFLHARDNPMISQDNLFYLLLSEVMNRLSSKDYVEYVRLDYQRYRKKSYQWNFASSSLDNYLEFQPLSGFTKLVRILANSMFIKDYTEFAVSESAEPIELEENRQELEEYLDRREKEQDKEIEKISRTAKPEYILSIPILDLIYREFNEELWDDITIMEFLDMFTTEIKKQDKFKLKPKQTTRFYFLLKKIWINSSNKSLFNTEKEWVIPFLQNYNLSYSAYTNQFIRNEGGMKHRNFMKSVDKILPKDEIE